MLALKQWKVEYTFRYKTKRNPFSDPDVNRDAIDVAYVAADSAEEAKKLVLEAAKTGAFDWFQHTFVGIDRMSELAQVQPLILSDRAIHMIQKHVQGSYIEREELVDTDLPFDRDV